MKTLSLVELDIIIYKRKTSNNWWTFEKNRNHHQISVSFYNRFLFWHLEKVACPAEPYVLTLLFTGSWYRSWPPWVYRVYYLIIVLLFICTSQEIESLLVNWSGPDLSGFGELVLEGSFKVHRVKKERAFFLFDKMLLIAKKRLEQFVYSTHIFVRVSFFITFFI